MSFLPTIKEEFSGEHVLTKICEFKNLTFCMTLFPEDVEQVHYVSFLKSNKVHEVVRTYTNESFLNYMFFLCDGIAEAIINFTDSSPDGFIMNLFMSSLKNFITEEKAVTIAIEESVEGAYVLAYALIELGIDWKTALKEIEKTGLRLKGAQVDYLKHKCHQLKKSQKETCKIF